MLWPQLNKTQAKCKASKPTVNKAIAKREPANPKLNNTLAIIKKIQAECKGTIPKVDKAVTKCKPAKPSVNNTLTKTKQKTPRLNVMQPSQKLARLNQMYVIQTKTKQYPRQGFVFLFFFLKKKARCKPTAPK